MGLLPIVYSNRLSSKPLGGVRNFGALQLGVGGIPMTDFLSLLKFSFFDMAIADIYRAIRGGSMMGAFTQSMCVIDAMAHIYNPLPGKTGDLNFKEWVKDFMVPLNKNCCPKVLYAFRCGLVHVYGYGRAMKSARVEDFAFIHGRPELHWARLEPDTYILNLDSHVAEVTVAAYNFFDKLETSCAGDPEQKSSLMDRAQKLVYVKRYIQDGQMPVETVIRTQGRFAKMDPALVSLDDPDQLQVDTIVDAIQRIYRKRAGVHTISRPRSQIPGQSQEIGAKVDKTGVFGTKLAELLNASPEELVTGWVRQLPVEKENPSNE